MNQTPTFNFNNYNAKPDLITCMIEDGTIQEINYTANTRKVIGVTKDTYNALVEENDNHIEMLYEAGVLERPKTQEEINNELVQTNKNMASMIQENMELMKEMKKEMSSLKKENTKLKKGVIANEPTNDNFDVIEVLPT